MAGANSTITVEKIADSAAMLGDIAPALATGGYNLPVDISNDVITPMLLGGPTGQAFNWKWNRANVPAFPTISWQQDYFIAGLVNVGWIESAWAININQTSIPKQKQYLEVKKDLMTSSDQNGYPGKICWMQNDTLMTGTWGQAPLGPTTGNPAGQLGIAGPSLSGTQNPGIGVIYTNPIGTLNQPANATTCIADAFGNLWVLTTYGTCGGSNPFSSNLNPVYPTYANPSIVATTAADGSCVWTAINPKGQGFRLSPVPPQTGIVWMIQPVCQMKVPVFTSLTQTLEPVPDDYHSYFKQGFIAQCYRRSPDPKIRAKFADEWKIWMSSLDSAVKQGDREADDFGFYPGNPGVMDTGMSINPINPANPFGYGW